MGATPDLTLVGLERAAPFVPTGPCTELGLSYKTKADRTADQRDQRPEYTKLNPRQKVPLRRTALLHWRKVPRSWPTSPNVLDTGTRA